MESKKGKKRIFILTDGDVKNKHDVINQASSDNDIHRVFTFGLGSQCDRELCFETARAGRGSCSIVEDGAVGLNG